MFLLLIVSFSAIADIKSDVAISKALVGEWEWNKSFEGCEEDGVAAFKSNGTYTITTEDCSIADDGFGYFHYGWFIANNYICLAYDERQSNEVKPSKEELKLFLKNKKAEGFNKQDCIWEVLSYTSKSITVKHTWNNDGNPVEEVFTLKKSRWL
jgi:hypothetical protein